MQKILFLCTGNYYRSPFAEHYFNHQAKNKNLNWRAISRGLNVVDGKNPGWISIHTINRLKSLGLNLEERIDFPKQVSLKELEEADIIIAIKKTEHLPYILKIFPHPENKVQYWEIHDVEVEEPATALVKLQEEIEALIENLGREQQKFIE